jgi:putative Ca2+/H+ antiporter (TMEM165/GDT1 family)
VRTGIILGGILGLALAVVVEVVGVFVAADVLQHNVYGFSGGILAVLGIVAISVGRTPKTLNSR